MISFITFINTLVEGLARLALPLIISILLFAGEPDIGDGLRQVYLEWAGLAVEDAVDP